MVLVSVQSVEDNNGYQFSNDFAESLIIDPKSRISLININFSRNKSLYTVDTSNDEFLIRFGEYNEDYEAVRITHGNYTSVALADEIQKQLNRHFFTMGYYFIFGYDAKDNKFLINYSYSENKVLNQEMTKWTIVADGTNPQIQYNATGENLEIIAANMTDLDRVYGVSQEELETQIVPLLSQGGSSISMMLRTNTTALWPAARPADAVPPTLGFVFGLTANGGAVQYAQGQSIAEVGRMGWCNAGLGFVTKADTSQFVRIVEEGHQVGEDIPHTVDDYTQYKVTLSPDGPDGVNGFPAYYFKRKGQINWTRIIPRSSAGGSATQNFSRELWAERKLLAVVGTDNEVAAQNTYPHFTNLLMAHANPNFQGISFAGPENSRVGPVPAALKIGEDKGSLDVSLTNSDSTMVGLDFDAIDTGFITPLIEPNRQSRMKFKMPKSGPVTYQAATGGRYQIAVLDETQRMKNFLADTSLLLGTNDPASGPGATAAGGQITLPGKHCALLTFQIEGNKWYYRNVYNTASVTTVTQPGSDFGGFNDITMARRTDITADLTNGSNWSWGSSPTEVFYITCHASINKMELGVSPSDSPTLTDYIKLKTFDICPATTSGVKTFTVINTGDYNTSSTGRFFRLKDRGDGCAFNADVAADGTLENVTLLTPGIGFTAGVTYTLTEFLGNSAGQSDTTEDTVTAGTIRVDSVVDYNFTSEFSMGYSPTTENNGYRYFVNVNNYVDKLNSIEGLGLFVEPEDDKLRANAYYYPNSKSPYNTSTGFGAMVGFGQDDYKLSSTNTISDMNPSTGQGVLDENLIVNVNNLPIKTYIGKKMKKDGAISDAPVGNVQGLTKTIGKVPRYYEENGSSGQHLSGPFYYDYFPYSVPLHNAVELNMNELDISINNQDGTLATDIAKSSLLLDITNVDNVGEGAHGGVTGNPIEAPRSFDMLNINNGQLQPAIKGGFAQGANAGFQGVAPRPRPEHL